MGASPNKYCKAAEKDGDQRSSAKLWRSVRRQHVSGTAGQMVEQAAYYTPGWMQLSITIL